MYIAGCKPCSCTNRLIHASWLLCVRIILSLRSIAQDVTFPFVTPLILTGLCYVVCLFVGEHIGDGSPPKVDIAVDPLDGTTLTAQGRSGALAVSHCYIHSLCYPFLVGTFSSLPWSAGAFVPNTGLGHESLGLS